MTGSYSLRANASLTVLWAALTIGSPPASAQNRGIEIGGHVSSLRLGDFDITAAGMGAHVVWPLTPVAAIDGELTWFPGAGDVTADRFRSQHRALGVAGLRVVAVTRRDVELFARARPGFLRFGEQGSAVCIALFPAPLECRLAIGYTAFAADVGGGASVGLARSGRLRARIQAGDLLVRYGLRAYRSQGEIPDGFIAHNLLVSVGLGWRF